MIVPAKIWLYRITHINNLGHALRHGLVTAGHSDANPEFVAIGDTTLIDYRKDLPAIHPPGGQLSDYVPFYFGSRSPMLFQIATGWENIRQLPQQDIIYLISSVESIKQHGLAFFFTDGHARSETSTFYNQVKDFDQLDWDTIQASYWKNDETDPRRKEKKQAELLVKDHVPWTCIEYIGVFNELAKQKVEGILTQAGMTCPIRVSPDKLYYQL